MVHDSLRITNDIRQLILLYYYNCTNLQFFHFITSHNIYEICPMHSQNVLSHLALHSMQIHWQILSRKSFYEHVPWRNGYANNSYGHFDKKCRTIFRMELAYDYSFRIWCNSYILLYCFNFIQINRYSHWEARCYSYHILTSTDFISWHHHIKQCASFYRSCYIMDIQYFLLLRHWHTDQCTGIIVTERKTDIGHSYGTFAIDCRLAPICPYW